MSIDKIRTFFKQKTREGTPELPHMQDLEHEMDLFRKDEAQKMQKMISNALTSGSLKRTDEIQQFFDEQLQKMSLSEILLLRFVLDAARRLAKEYKRSENGVTALEIEHVYDFIRPSAPERGFRMIKTGGNLDLIQTKDGVVLKNTVSRRNADTWKSAAKYVPVAPIVKWGNYTRQTQEVYTRYCGFSYSASQHIFEDVFPHLATDLRNQRYRHTAVLNQHHIFHGHPHTGNFRVEFVRKEALTKHAATKGVSIQSERDLYNPELLNTLPFAMGDILFDPADFARNMDAYIPVVRVIDFDLAEEMPDTEPSEIWKQEIRGAELDANEIAGVERVMKKLGTFSETPKA